MESLSRYYYILSPLWTIYTIGKQIRYAILLKFSFLFSDVYFIYYTYILCLYIFCFLHAHFSCIVQREKFCFEFYRIDHLKCALGAYI